MNFINLRYKSLNIVLIIISIVFINLSSLKPLYANHCPTGFVEITKFVMVNLNNTICQYRVTMCVSCPAGPYPLPCSVKLSKFEAYPINCGFDPLQVKDEIINIITNPDWITKNIGTDCFAGWGPCPENAVTVTEVFPICWQKVKYIDDEQNPPVTRVYYVSCADASCECRRDKIICWNGEEFKTIYITDYYRSEIGCFDECENLLEPDDSTIPDPTEEMPFPTSVCFGLRGPCNP